MNSRFWAIFARVDKGYACQRYGFTAEPDLAKAIPGEITFRPFGEGLIPCNCPSHSSVSVKTRGSESRWNRTSAVKPIRETRTRHWRGLHELSPVSHKTGDCPRSDGYDLYILLVISMLYVWFGAGDSA